MASSATSDARTPSTTVNRGQRLRERLEREASEATGNVYAPDCPSRALLEHVTSRWGVLVLVLLMDGTYRFSELAAIIPGVSDKMLSQTLKQLTSDGFIARTVSDEPPVRVSYELTEPGLGVAERLAELVEWLEGNAGALLAANV